MRRRKIDDLVVEASDELVQELKRAEERTELINAKNIYDLQMKTGMTLKEARAYMVGYWERPASIMDDYGISIQALCNLQRRAREKVAALGMTDEEIFGAYPPNVVIYD